MNTFADIYEMSNAELALIIQAFYACGDCSACPCDGILCGGNNENKRHAFALEVASRLKKGV